MLDRLHTNGLIGDPKDKNTSVELTDAGVANAAAALQRVFGVDSDDGGRVRGRARVALLSLIRGVIRKASCRYKVNNCAITARLILSG